jgi:uncharacterized protein (DUF1778 family)
LYGKIPYNVTCKGKGKVVLMKQAIRTVRFEARFAPEALELVRSAAELMGRSVSDFIVTAAQEAARKTIEEERVIRLSVEDQRRFAETLANPSALSPAMERAREAHDLLIRKSS